MKLNFLKENPILNILDLPPTYDIDKYGRPIVRMRDLSENDQSIRNEYHAALEEVLNHGMLIKGPEVKETENLLKELTGKEYNVLVSCASSGLLLSLQAIGIEEGDEVITTPLSWLMTSSVIKQLGAKPVFVDVCSDYNINIDLIEDNITSKTKAILPVHYYGKVLDSPRIKSICDKHNLYLIEDVAQAAGGKINGSMAGEKADISVYSFGPMKNLHALGDLGCVSTDESEIANNIKYLSECGVKNNEICIHPNLKHYPDAIQASFLRVILKRWNHLINKRINFANQYSKNLSNIQEIKLPTYLNLGSHTFFDYTINTPSKSFRDKLIQYLFENKIEAKVRHPLSICEQPFINTDKNCKCTKARELVQTSLCLPMHYNLTSHDIIKVSNIIKKFIDI
ncbi:DegT/DnrJ/EryC1/StrS family aminotransferase [Prochlorococcus marinus XMU1412]|uniref:DegT/DnrJ/EryC1/StrS family aminotransferase n=1 Tax=Prochlorococcus marinus TaxID=1219 RepID=UPI001ADA6D4E|nr:DegT/DnrJ/EryC1/StrS family aminotransferase [Prochlorococcus marinus]MBO8240558.1 DegT/DnrJ/EryC1/StrS family aminotransferase [Prochlorococcus marinus XMU1412]MBW3071793.1 hypothetical protein [Prochlorococcus marinus str. MU1412]